MRDAVIIVLECDWEHVGSSDAECDASEWVR
jgi:hypothetical protein